MLWWPFGPHACRQHRAPSIPPAHRPNGPTEHSPRLSEAMPWVWMPFSIRALFFNDAAASEICALSLHDALPIWSQALEDRVLIGVSSAPSGRTRDALLTRGIASLSPGLCSGGPSGHTRVDNIARPPSPLPTGPTGRRSIAQG